MAIIIIQPTPGPTTKDKILTFIEQEPTGVRLRDICQAINRPMSMVQRYLKILSKEGKINAQLSENGMQLVYYPGRRQRGKNYQVAIKKEG